MCFKNTYYLCIRFKNNNVSPLIHSTIMTKISIIISNERTNRTHSTDLFFSDINRIKIDAKEVDEFARLYQVTHNEQYANKIVCANLKFAVSFAKQYQHLGLDYDDILQYANMGLVFAARNYVPSDNNTFLSYAIHYMRKYVNKGLTENGRIVRVPDYEIRKGNTTYTASLDTPLSNDGDDKEKTYGDTFASDSKANQYDDDNETLYKVKCLLDKLEQINGDKKGAKYKEIMCMLFGIGCREYSLWEIAYTFNCTEERIRQIKKDCLKAMKDFI